MKAQEKFQKQEEMKVQKLYDKMLAAIEKQMNEEDLSSAQKRDIVENVKMDMLKQAQSSLWRQQFDGSSSKETLEKTMHSMGEYVKSRY